ncbi:MAG TPA: RDD family protein [Candidatus Dormibacteraeota bacterium]
MTTFGTPPDDPQQPQPAPADPAEPAEPQAEPPVGAGTVSPDGAWVWDGYRWTPNPAAPPPPPGYPAPTGYGPPPGYPGYGPPATGPAPGLEYAGFGIRLVAYLIDSAIMFVVIFAVAAATGGLFKTDPDTGVTAINGAAQGLAFAISIAYLVGFWGARSQTPGMMALNLRIVRAQTGQPLDFGVAVLRYVGYVISSIPFGIGLVWAAFDPRKQGWHDKIAGTVVIRPVAS